MSQIAQVEFLCSSCAHKNILPLTASEAENLELRSKLFTAVSMIVHLSDGGQLASAKIGKLVVEASVLLKDHGIIMVPGAETYGDKSAPMTEMNKNVQAHLDDLKAHGVDITAEATEATVTSNVGHMEPVIHVSIQQVEAKDRKKRIEDVDDVLRRKNVYQSQDAEIASLRNALVRVLAMPFNVMTATPESRDLRCVARAALEKYPAKPLAPEIARCNAETNAAIRARDAWERDAQRYAQNADFWREKYEATKVKHPMAPDRCTDCNWANTDLMNYGTSRESKWLCHGCAARAIAGEAPIDPSPSVETVAGNYVTFSRRQLIEKIERLDARFGELAEQFIEFRKNAPSSAVQSHEKAIVSMSETLTYLTEAGTAQVERIENLEAEAKRISVSHNDRMLQLEARIDHLVAAVQRNGSA